MLEKDITDKIIALVQQKPRTVQEIAHAIQKNWRTANRYVDKIALETGAIAVRVFREGTQGALKLVYAPTQPGKGSAYQDMLFQRLSQGTHKEDFSPFDIYQFAAADKRQAFVEQSEYPSAKMLDYTHLFEKAQRQLLLFSGNLSWIDMDKTAKTAALESAAQRKVSIKILTRIDITSRANVGKLLAINRRVGWNAIEVRHAEQPLRAVVVDDSIVCLKEVHSPDRYKPGELKKRTFLFYNIEDPEWIGWVQKVFWHVFGRSIDAETRLRALESLHEESE